MIFNEEETLNSNFCGVYLISGIILRNLMYITLFNLFTMSQNKIVELRILILRKDK